MANTHLTRTNGSPTNPKKYTWSSWNKIDSNAWMPFFSTTHQGGHSYIGFSASSDSFGVIEHGDSAGTLYYVATSAVQRDNSGWYHVVVQFDSTQSTASDRVKLYINNELQTSLSQTTYPSQNLDSWLCDATTIEIGRRSAGSGQYYSGLISHAHFIDGTIYGPSTFGETDSTNGEWKIKTDPGISTANYGNNGFWMFKDDNSYNDDSGNGNNFSLGGGTLTKTESNPSNVFATWNPLWSQSNGNVGDVTFSNGNTTTITSVNYRTTPANLGMKTGKYYWEVKRNEDSGSNDLHGGIMSELATPANTATWIGNAANGWVNAGDGGEKYTGGTSGGSTGAQAANSGDIMMFAYDADNGKLYFGVNGSWGNSANPATGANPHYDSLDTTLFYFPCVSTGSDCSVNFGNGYFGTTAISSAGTNASGIGLFEYNVPTGFTAFSTKGINSF